MRFLAIDFETANDDRSSAKAIGLVLTDGTHVLDQHYAPIGHSQGSKPTQVHGIELDDPSDKKDFASLWPDIAPLVAAADAFVAHDARFVRGVLEHLLDGAKVNHPKRPIVSTKRLSQRTWPLSDHDLPAVAQHLGIPTDTENALSKALACARILGRAIAAGARLGDGVTNQMRLTTISTKVEPLVPHEIRTNPAAMRFGTPAMAWVIAVVGSLLLLAVP
jgi:DNA polymerase III subunit epsilon